MQKRKGFTLIELLVVVVIIGILIAVALPQINKYINNAKATTLLSDTNTFSKDFLPFVTAEIPTDRGFKTAANDIYKAAGEVVFRDDATGAVETGITEAAPATLDGTNPLKTVLQSDYQVDTKLTGAKFKYIVKANDWDITTSAANIINDFTTNSMNAGFIGLVSYAATPGDSNTSYKTILIYCGDGGVQAAGKLKDATANGDLKYIMDALVADATHKGSCVPSVLSAE